MRIERIEGLPESARLAVTELTFINSKYDDELWQNHLNPLLKKVEQTYSTEKIREDERISSTKQAYRQLGLDPSRYRPSSESLLRRVSKGKGLYQINTLVDINNYLSILFRLPVGSYDVEQMTASIHYGVGQAGESYEAIGKKRMDINHFPVLIDEKGPFGSPISDSTKAMISLDTTHALLVVYSFDQPEEELVEIQQQSRKVLQELIPTAKIIKQMII